MQRNGREYSAGVKLTRVKSHDSRTGRGGKRNEYRGNESRRSEYGRSGHRNEDEIDECRRSQYRRSEDSRDEYGGSEDRRGKYGRNEYGIGGDRRSEYGRNKDRRRIIKGSENRWIAFMALITVLLVFLSVKSVYGLISFQKTPDIIGAARIIPEENERTGSLLPAKDDIVPLADHYGEDAPVVAIDPGHGGIDNGSNINGIYEQEINMEISRLLADRLEEMGMKTVLLREDNDTYLSLEDRVENAENAGADIYVSIHQNFYDGSDPSVSGLETWYNDKLEDSRRLAQLVHDGAVGKTSAVDRGLMETDDLYVVCRTSMPSCLIETGFLSNKAEREALLTKEYQEKLAEGIAEGIDNYFSSRQEKPAAD